MTTLSNNYMTTSHTSVCLKNSRRLVSYTNNTEQRSTKFAVSLHGNDATTSSREERERALRESARESIIAAAVCGSRSFDEYTTTRAGPAIHRRAVYRLSLYLSLESFVDSDTRSARDPTSQPRRTKREPFPLFPTGLVGCAGLLVYLLTTADRAREEREKKKKDREGHTHAR